MIQGHHIDYDKDWIVDLLEQDLKLMPRLQIFCTACVMNGIECVVSWI